MLIRFNVGNFLSFNEIQEFSMIAGKVRNKSERVCDDHSVKTLKFAAIFGANASGKSNLVSAISFAKNIIVDGFPSNSTRSYCKINKQNKEKPSYFEFEVKLNGKYYSYGYEAILSEPVIVSEWLFELLPSGSEREIFSRDVKNGTFSISKYFKENDLVSKLNLYADDIKKDGSVLFLQLLNRNKNSFYDENVEAAIIKELYYWFDENLDINFPDKPITNYSYFVSEKNASQICETLSAFGTGITKYSFDKASPEKISGIPQKLRESITEYLAKSISENKKNGKKANVFLRSSQKEFYFFEVDKEDNIICKTIQFNHGDDEIFFLLSEESDGTARLIDLITILFETNRNKTFIVDEIDRCLHPQLTYKFVSEFLKVAANNNIQLIVTTHESRLLDFNLLRKDEIWFVNKDNKGQSLIYSLDEYNERFDKKIDKAYLEGRYGGVPIFSTVFPIEGEK